ncbi:MAG: asparagine synthase (glutamine-hydrolyzing) [Candidatus Polarisedimenticolia bacterium]
MCGIAGILSLEPGARPDPARLRRMARSLEHRGPDGEGILVDGPVGLAHRRLAIVDLAGGAQPMSTEDGALHVVYNGEIYNHLHLRAELESHGRRYLTRSDTETLLHLYAETGTTCVRRLEGMFAFALWDRARRRLLLARDRLGIKPLYYALTPTELIFGSEIKAILAAGGISPELNRAVIPEYLATRFVSGEETFFRGVRKLLPGRLLTWSPETGIRKERWWQAPEVGPPPRGGMEKTAAGVRDRVTAAARSHLMSDVPLGLFLSGGLDSSALAALVAPMAGGELNTFSVGFDDPLASELPWARLAARAVGARHHEVTVTPAEFLGALPRLIWHEDEPIAFTSSVPLYFVSRLARRHVKVVLTGEGADELFLGYNRYRVTAWNERLGRGWWSIPGVASTLAHAVSAFPASLRSRAQRTFLTRRPGPRDLFFDNFAVVPLSLQRGLLTEQLAAEARDPYAEPMRCWHEAHGGVVDRMSRADMQTYLVELLMKQDQMSMAASLESRVPFLDAGLVDHVLSLPGSVKLPGWRTKVLLRAALGDLVPPPILRRRKMGFPVPLGPWLRGPHRSLVEDLVLGPRALARGLFHPEPLRRMCARHFEGEADHAERLWLLLNLETWQRIFLDGEEPPPVPGGAHA